MDCAFIGVNLILLAGLSNVISFLNGGPQWPLNDKHCKRNATCVSNNFDCFGTPLPYSEISTEVVVELFNNTQLANFNYLSQDLNSWKSLRKVPKCWQTLQPFLCALYMPKCEHKSIYLLSQEWCRNTMATCKILKEPQFADKFPVINCDAIENPQPTCKNDFKDLRSNLSGECIAPLIHVDNLESQYDMVNGCGVQCEDPKITKDEHEQIHGMIAWGASTSFACNLFAVLSFLIEWRSGSKYPALIIFYINLCFMISNLGWLAQFLPNTRADIVCKKDLTLRRHVPSAGENLTCVTVFIFIYYSLMAACVWFVILTYAWHLSFRALGKIQERIEKKGAYFHLAAWSLPVVLTIITVASRQIEGNSTTGICFVQSSSWEARVGLLLVPIAATILVGGYFLGRGLPFLFIIRRESQQILSAKASDKIRRMIVRIGFFSFFSFLFVVVTFICHVYEFTHAEEWEISFKKYVFCRILESNPNECQMESRPSVAMIQLQLLIMFSAGVLMSTWVWTSQTAERWQRFIKKHIFKKEIEEQVVLKKHKIIAEAFAKRKEILNAGKLDLSIKNSSHTDPLGWKFELNSAASRLSSNWIAAIPKLIDRRMAWPGPGCNTESNSSRRRNSYDSRDSRESYTLNVRRVSVESRRNSADSQYSLQYSEVTATHKTTSAQRSGHRNRFREKRRRKAFSRDRRHHNVARRGSSTSQESQIGLKILTALALNNSAILPKNLLKRRTGNAGLDGDDSLPGTFSIPGIDMSDDEPSHDANVEQSDDDNSNQSDEDCLRSRGIDVESDSDTEEDELPRYKKAVNSYRSEKAITALQSNNKKKLEIKNVEYHKKSFEHDLKSKYKSNESSNHHRNNQTSDLMSLVPVKCLLLDENPPRKSKNRKDSNSDFDAIEMNKLENKKKYQSKKHNRTQTNHDSESDYDEETHLMQSVGNQIRAGSSRSKRSVTVDVGTQISTQEMATQTDVHDYNGVAVNKSETQGTQMTPPLHIRLINKTLGTNGHSSQLRENKYTFSPISD